MNTKPKMYTVQVFTACSFCVHALRFFPCNKWRFILQNRINIFFFFSHLSKPKGLCGDLFIIGYNLMDIIQQQKCFEK